MGSTEDSDRKRRNFNHSVSPVVMKQSLTPSSEKKKVDAQMLHYQNSKLSQLLEVQRNEINVLEGKLNQLHNKQVSFDENLSIVSRVWDQVVDDLELLTVRVGPTSNGTHALGSPHDRDNASFRPEQTFLQRLLDRGATDNSTINRSNGSVESGLFSRKADIAMTVTYLVQSIDYERARNDELVSSLRNDIASIDVAGVNGSLAKADEELYAEAKKVRGFVEDLHLKHRQLSAELGTCGDFQAKDQAEVKRLKGELEEVCADLEANRRQLTAFRSQDATLSGSATPSATPTRKMFEVREGDAEQGKFPEENCELETGLEEAKSLAARSLTELQEAMHNHLDDIRKIQQMQDELDDQESIISFRQYQSLDEQVQYLRTEVEKYRAVVDELQVWLSFDHHVSLRISVSENRTRKTSDVQVERVSLVRQEKEVILKAEAGDAARRAGAISDARAADLELKLQQCMSDCDTMRLRIEDATRASGRKESVADLKKESTNLHEDMNMIQTQLDDFKETGSAVHSLRAKLHSLHLILERKTLESRLLSDQYAGQVRELNFIQDEVRGLRDSEKELKLILDMYDRELSDPREVRELQQADCRALAEVKRLQLALDEHNLERRVKDANEAEAACQQKLTAVDAEIAELRQNLDVSYKVAQDLRESLQTKKEEEDTYISEIDDITQAYIDMQIQNRKLLQEIIERDEYNAQLMSDSLKAKQLQTSLQAEKQVLNARMQHARAFIHEHGKAIDESRHQSSAMESAKRKAVEMEKELASAKSALAAADKLLEERGQRLLNVNLQLGKERFEKRRAQEDLKIVNMKTARLHSLHDVGSTAERLQEQVNDYRAILQCNVCHDRNFQAIITKCYHLFCMPCIQRNLESKHRKCPGCGIPFGQNDVRSVYI
ncbi:E3 ubiquitin-protein ligase BRE1-like 2 isoform X3 [Physcomitrium patens]|uniref:E3 ubiquitin-protein ligase BRE1-like 2 isoform X3 n=1 Tax=Physcomitrium patens TaxID=3218 RepID=UPI000D15600B|nr:E3 ubiquitin-protein ligase BRE1-like 2 isoform X3 [Physcomitrium patens]|eukprot:XP_024365297.1 E3 ubiquitin-protein ligase BRE1-like 2 isoform X3 [Physcomitrella patens]